MTTLASPGAHPARANSHWLRGDVMPFAVIVLVITATRGIWFGNPVADYDEQLYSFIGWRMQFGELPFVDWWDRKPFGLFAIFGAAHWLFGPGPLAYQFVAAGFALLSAWMTYRLARLLVGRASATLAAIIQTVLLCAYASYSAQSEVFFLPLMLGMALLLVDPQHPHFRRRALVAMLLGGIALQIKYTVLPQCAFFGLYALWVEYRRSSTLPYVAALGAAFVALGLAPTVAVALLYAGVGGFDAFVFANFLSFFDRMPAPQGRWAPDFWLGVAPLVIVGGGGIYAAFRMIRPEPFATWLFFAGWALASLATAFLPSTVYLYYFAAVSAPIALVGLPLLNAKGPLKLYPGLFLAAGFLALLNLPDRYAESQQQTAAAEQLASAIAPHVDRRDTCLWIFDGPTALYRMSDSCVPTRLVYPDHLNNALEINALDVDQGDEVRRILAMEPGAIVTASRPVTVQNEETTALVEAALDTDYYESRSVDLQDRILTVWIRR